MSTSFLAKPPLRRQRPRNRCAEASAEAAGVLARVRRTQDAVRAGEVQILEQAVEWARLHEVDEHSDDAATWGDTPVPLAGEGAPRIAEFAIPEFAAAVGMGTEAGRHFIAHALELAHRLPLTFAQVLSGAVPVWRARRVAEKALHLSAEAAAYVDVEIAPVAATIGPVVTERLVDEAIIRFMPEYALELAERAAERRCVSIDHRQASGGGTSTVLAELDLADALDLDEALARGAEHLKEQGSTDPLDVRRAHALGNLARGEQQRSELVLYVHLKPGDAHAVTEHGGNALVSADQVRAWCGTTENVVVKPVIDLAEEIASGGYVPPERLREQVVLRDRTCAHPYCNRRARRADLDHIEEYARGGRTASSNLAALCRFHHRLKTHGGWTYTMIRPGTYLWRSPYGYRYLRRADGGTEDVTPRPASLELPRE